MPMSWPRRASPAQPRLKGAAETAAKSCKKCPGISEQHPRCRVDRDRYSWSLIMRTIKTFAFAAAAAGSVLLSLPASAAEVCDRNCVGPLCGESCTRTPDVTVGRGVREPDVVIGERRRVREPGVEIRRPDPRPGIGVEIR